MSNNIEINIEVRGKSLYTKIHQKDISASVTMEENGEISEYLDSEELQKKIIDLIPGYNREWDYVNRYYVTCMYQIGGEKIVKKFSLKIENDNYTSSETRTELKKNSNYIIDSNIVMDVDYSYVDLGPNLDSSSCEGECWDCGSDCANSIFHN